MATATNKKSAAKVRKPAPKAAGGRSGKATRPAATSLDAKALDDTSLDDIDEPDRAAPPLAEVDAEALEFIAAIDRFKKAHGRPFPSWSEVLLIVRQLGYVRR